MGNFQVGPKVLIVNDPAVAPLRFFARFADGEYNLVETDDDFGVAEIDLATDPDTQTAEGTTYSPVAPEDGAVSVTFAEAGMMQITGFGQFENAASDRNAVQSIVGAKGVPAQAQVGTLTFTLGTFTPGTTTSIMIKFASSGLIGEFSTWFSDYKKPKYYNIDTITGDTPTTVAARFASIVQQDLDSLAANLITVSAALGVVTITCISEQIYIESVTAEGIDYATGDVGVAWAVTTDWYGGRNTWEQLKALRLQTPASVYPYTQEVVSDQLPLKNATYSSYLITINWSRPDLQGGTVMNEGISGSNQFHIFINESTAADYLAAFIAWFNAGDRVGITELMYTDTVAQDVIDTDATQAGPIT